MYANIARRTLAGRIAASAGAAITLLFSVLLAIPAHATTGQRHAVAAKSMPAINHGGGINYPRDANSDKLIAATTDLPTAGVAYTIKNVFSGLCLDDYQFSTSDNTDIVQHTCDGYTNQEWRFVASPTYAVYYIQNVFSGKCLDDYQFSTSDGTPIVQHTCNGYTNQEWVLLAYQGNLGISVTNIFSGKVLDDYGFSTTKNIIRQYHYDGYTNQQWHLN